MKKTWLAGSGVATALLINLVFPLDAAAQSPDTKTESREEQGEIQSSAEVLPSQESLDTESPGIVEWVIRAYEALLGGVRDATDSKSNTKDTQSNDSQSILSSGMVMAYEYDANGRLVRVAVSGGVSDGAEERYEYDAADNRTLREVTAP